MSRKIDYLINLLVNEGYTVNKFNTEKKDDAMIETIRTCEEEIGRASCRERV